MEYQENVKYPLTESESICVWGKEHREYDVNEYAEYVEVVKRAPEQLKADEIREFKAELAKIKEDIEQEIFGLVRDDYAAKKARAAEIINELRVLEGKEPREKKI